MHCNVHSSIIYNCQDMEKTCVCQQMKDKEDVAQARAESQHPLPTMVMGSGLPCLSPEAQDKYPSDADAGKQTEARGQSQRS